MTRLGRNAIRRAEDKGARRRNRQAKRGRRVAAGVAAMATVAAVGVGQAMSHAPAQAEGSDWTSLVQSINLANPAENIGDIVGDIVNDPTAQALLDEWRIRACASGGESVGADCTQSSGTGIAAVLPDTLELVPVTAYNGPSTTGSATVIGSGFQFALAYRGGEATAISYLPVSLATAGASDGRKAYAFALVGMANAWTTDALPVTVLGAEITSIPGIKSVSCYGGLTAAYAEGVGACVNILGTLDFRWDAEKNQLQFGLTDPSAVLFDPSGVFTQVVTQLLNGEPISLSKDLLRLTLGGSTTDAYGLPVLVSLTSDYGEQDPITIDWLGSSITLNPETLVNGVSKPNYLGLPVISLGQLDTGDIIPVVHLPEFTFPFGLGSTSATDIPSSTTTMSTVASSTEDDAVSTSQLRTTLTDTTEQTDDTATDDTATDDTATDDTATDDTATDDTTDTTVTTQTVETQTTGTSTGDQSEQHSYVGRHRSQDTHHTSYQGRHRAEGAQHSDTSSNTTTTTTTGESTHDGSGDSGAGNAGSSDTSTSNSGDSDS